MGHLFVTEVVLGNFGTYLLGLTLGIGGRNSPQQQTKLLAAQAAKQIIGPEPVFQQLHQLLQYGITTVVAVAVIGGLEVVNIEQQKGKFAQSSIGFGLARRQFSKKRRRFMAPVSGSVLASFSSRLKLR